MFLIKKFLRRRFHRSTFYDYYDNEMPVYSTMDIGDIVEGVSYRVSGYILPNCERLSISLIIANDNNDIALRINPRLPQNYIVRNSRLSHRWGEDEDSSTFPFPLRRGRNFVIEILITDLRYLISVNGRHFAKYNHRVPYNLVDCIEVHGDVDNVAVKRTEFKEYPHRLTALQPKLIPLKLHDQDSSIRRCTIHNRHSLLRDVHVGLTLPYYGFLEPTSLIMGKHLRLEAQVKVLPLSFYVNLQCGQNIWPHPIVPFHFRCRFAKHRDYIGKNVITRNAWFDGQWSKEEVSELKTELRPSKLFSMVIVRGSSSYKVYVDKKFILEFRYRVDPDTADTVYVIGDIKLFRVVLENHDGTMFFNPAGSIFDFLLS